MVYIVANAGGRGKVMVRVASSHELSVGLAIYFQVWVFFFFFLNSEYVFGTAAVQDTPCKEAQIPRQGFLVQRNINCLTRLS